MVLASASNAGNGVISSFWGNIFSSSIFWGIVTGIISSVIVTVVYRIIDSERIRATFLQELSLFSAKTSLMLVSWLSASENKIILQQIYNLMYTCPSWFRWIRFAKEEKKIVEFIFDESKKILADIAQSEMLEQQIKCNDFVKSDKEKWAKEITDIRKGLVDRLPRFMKNQDELREILKKYTEKKQSIFLRILRTSK